MKPEPLTWIGVNIVAGTLLAFTGLAAIALTAYWFGIICCVAGVQSLLLAMAQARLRETQQREAGRG